MRVRSRTLKEIHDDEGSRQKDLNLVLEELWRLDRMEGGN